MGGGWASRQGPFFVCYNEKMAKRRGRGEGTIQQLPSGNWRAQLSVGGKRISHTAKTRRECQTWIRRVAGQVERGLTYDRSRVSLGDYLASWLAGQASQLRPSTLAHYTILIEKFLLPAAGGAPIRELSPDHIQHMYGEWLRSGVGAPTVIKIHAVLHAALERAVETGLVLRNAADVANPPRAPHTEMQFWTEEESNRFLTANRQERLYALYYLAIVTGARQMELLGLQWADVDWVRETLTIRRQLARMGGAMFAALKTRASRRTIRLGGGTIAVLRGHLERQAVERQIAGDRWQEHGLLFTTLRGTPMHHKNLMDRYFKPAIRRAGVPMIRFHDLRHTAAAIMLSRGRPAIAVSRILGHARISITLDIYGHLAPGVHDSTDMMDDLVAPVAIEVEEPAT